jgi:ParB-like chromosome segregation protein Spo0J
VQFREIQNFRKWRFYADSAYNKKMTELKIETVSIASLVSDPANARTHDGKNLKAIENSLLKFGQRKPICVTPDSIVVAGNGTLEAAKNLGWTQIAIARTPIGWSWEQVRAFALADNRSAELAEWDDKVLADRLLELDANGWELEELGFENLHPPTESDWDGALDGAMSEQPEFRQWAFSLSERQYQIVHAAIKKASADSKKIDNENSNANALTEICENYVG